MAKSKEDIQEWKEYRLSLLEQKSKSDDDFEKYITFIASGGLGLTITFINEISPLGESKHVYLIIAGWILLTFTLLINLFSHFLSSRNNEKTVQDIDDEIDYYKLVENINQRNNNIFYLNLSSIIFLGFGIISIIIYVSINAYK